MWLTDSSDLLRRRMRYANGEAHGKCIQEHVDLELSDFGSSNSRSYCPEAPAVRTMKMLRQWRELRERL